MNIEPSVIRYRTEYRAASFLVFKEGRKYVHAVTMDPIVKVVEIPKEEARYFVPLELRGKPYPVARAARKFLAAGKALGITDGAKSALIEIKERA